MIALKLIGYILFAYGMANMVVYANGPFGIFEKWRNLTHRINESLGELFTCMICLSTWIGLVFSLINTYLVPDVEFTPFNMVFGTDGYVVLKTLMDMCLTSGIVWILHNLEEAMERHGRYEVVEELPEGEIKPDIDGEG